MNGIEIIRTLVPPLRFERDEELEEIARIMGIPWCHWCHRPIFAEPGFVELWHAADCRRPLIPGIDYIPELAPELPPHLRVTQDDMDGWHSALLEN